MTAVRTADDDSKPLVKADSRAVTFALPCKMPAVTFTTA